jgi:hypothetical protein
VEITPTDEKAFGFDDLEGEISDWVHTEPPCSKAEGEFLQDMCERTCVSIARIERSCILEHEDESTNLEQQQSDNSSLDVDYSSDDSETTG